MRAPRRRACSSSSRMSAAAPSATTKPSRSASNGRLAAVGIVVARGERLHARESGHRGVGHRSLAAAGDHDVGIAAPDDLVGLADGVARRGTGAGGGVVGAQRAEHDAGHAGGHVGDGHGDEEGADAVGPSMRMVAIWSMSVLVPPRPDDMRMPVTSASSPSRRSGRPASSKASRVATSAICVVRSLRRTSLRSSTSEGSKSSTSPAIRLVSPEASKSVMGPTPDSPATRRRQ